MYSALVIASRFIDLGIQSGKPVSPMKLQKMVYFAQGVHLARYDKPLISEAVEAWTYGPVIPSLYHTFKHLGNSPIVEPALIGVKFEGQFYPKINALDDNAQDSINLTWEITRDFSAIQLSEWSHLKGSPWSQVYSGTPESKPIALEVIKNYFESLINKIAHSNAA